MKNPNSSACSLSREYEESYLQEGDIMLGILIDIFSLIDDDLETFTAHPEKEYYVLSVSSSPLQYYRHFLAAIFAIEEINSNLNLLPNVTLGFHIHDSWANERKATSSTFSMLTGSSDYVPNYKCTQNRIPSAFIGHLLSSVSNVMYQITSIYGFPQVSYGAVDPAFSDRIRFPLFYRTVPSETAQYQVIIQLIKAFNWNWVGMISSDDETHQKASEEMKTEIINNGICVAFLVQISDIDATTDSTRFYFALQTIMQSNARVVIIYSKLISLMAFHINLLSVYSSTNVVWLILSPLPSALETEYSNEFNGSLLILFHQGNIPGLKDFLYKADPSRFPKDPFTAEVWLQVFKCRSGQYFAKSSLHICNANDTLTQYNTHGHDISSFRLTYSMYIAVYAAAHALHAMYTTNLPKPTQLNQHLKKIHFRTNTGDEIFFNEKGEVLGHFDIINWNIFHNETVTTRHVGTFNSSQSPGLAIDKEAILWASHFNGIPFSNCSASCLPGYRKAFVEGKHVCCYECVPCSEGEISPLPDMENCLTCPKDQWPNESRDKCIMKDIDFLSYKEPLGVALTTTALVLSFCSAAVFCIFLKHKKSPIVKANNQELSYILLLSLMLSFLCSLLFIGRPKKVTCLLRQTSFGIIFAICISSILGKTITVIIAFTATRPGSRLRNYVGTRVPKYILLLCTLPEVFITTGKYLAAVEIFAILVSSAGLLGLIFIPKCYFILIKQPVNTRHD
ncbi:vomeronasal type-2 receptor 26-like [Xenopus tropicalis]|uniref:Vomeronasal type-2 receptor 26-like n=1 Tax=Xenopus tropicalis TaxID=8364 RepID=A0A8J1IPS7_XENTR|nr:vomeronasal type-2 receptor 26-like [Xenopus tropicalis]